MTNKMTPDQATKILRNIRHYAGTCYDGRTSDSKIFKAVLEKIVEEASDILNNFDFGEE